MTIIFIFGAGPNRPDPQEPLVCRISEEDKRILYQLSDVAYSKMVSAARDVSDSFEDPKLGAVPRCVKSQAEIVATTNVLLRQLVVHRNIHGEKSVPTLSGRPDILKVVVEDLNVILTAMLRGMDPKATYVYHLARVENV